MANEPRGIRNKNYLNVKNGTDPWVDAGGARAKADPEGHAVFKDAAYGIRAGIKTLRTYFTKHKLQTIAEILARWAPATDTVGSLPDGPMNSPLKYSQFVSKQTGIGYNTRLELFDEEGHIGDVGQLKDVFFAMAAYEIGKVNGDWFIVPEVEWTAGLELAEPGISTEGTESTDVAVHVPVTGVLNAQISASVGAWEKGGVNKQEDVETVQALLREAAMILGNPRLDPGEIDGAITTKWQDSATVRAIVAFQRRYFTNPDGIIDVAGRTWRELIAVVNGGAQTEAETVSTAGAEFFPFTKLPAVNWTDSPRKFAANRANGRAHAGCDLYFPAGTVIHAIADGTVTRGPYLFYAGTYALEVDHGSFTARYGELQPTAFVRAGDQVRAGEPIAKVGHLVGITVPSDMLHLELYSNQAHGPLTVSASQGAVSANGRPFMRRKDLIDPTPKLNVWKNNLPGQPSVVSIVSGISKKGFCIHLVRKREETRSGMGFSRTVGDYQC